MNRKDTNKKLQDVYRYFWCGVEKLEYAKSGVAIEVTKSITYVMIKQDTSIIKYDVII